MTSQVNPGQWPPEVEHLPVCPRRRLPIPFIAEVGAGGIGHFTILDSDRARECLEGRLCAMCGQPMGAEVALLGDVASLEPDGRHRSAAHEEETLLPACLRALREATTG